MFLPRSISLRRYAVAGKRPDPHAPEFIEALQQRRFLGLQPGSAEDEALGWVDFGNFLDTDPIVDQLLTGNTLRLGLRLDKLSVPGALVKAHVDLERRALAQTGSQPTKRELDQIREGVIEHLRERTQPRTQHWRALWSLHRKRVYLLTLSDATAERFAHYFDGTWPKHKLSSLEPATLPRQLGVSPELIGRLEVVEPSDFTPREPRS